jgi:gluconokinase
LKQPILIIVMGVSGAGKTTVGRALAEALGAEFHDADEYHPRANIDKMSRGMPLDETDRAPWLAALRNASDVWLAAGGRHVLACSALTGRSREQLGVDRSAVALVYLRATRRLVETRMRDRNHFMPAALAESQFETLEPPSEAIEVDAALPVGILVERIRAALDDAV